MSRWQTDWRPPMALRRLAARWRRPHALLLHAGGVWDATRQCSAASLAAWCQAHPGQALRLHVSGQLLHEAVCSPSLALRTVSAVRDHLRQLLTHYHGLAAQAWPLATWRAGGCRGASALHGADLPALRAVAAAHGVHLCAVRPWWAGALQLALQRDPALGRAGRAVLLLVEGLQLTWIDLVNGCCTGVRHQRLDAPTPEFLELSLADAAIAGPGGAHWLLGWGLAAPLQLPPPPGVTLLGSLHAAGPLEAWLGGPARSRRNLPAPDLLRQHPSPPWQARLTAIVALALLLAAALHAQAGFAALQVEQQALDATRRTAAARSAPQQQLLADHHTAPPPAATVVRDLHALLQHHWGDLLLDVETSAASGMRWLVLDHRARSGDVRLEGLAASSAQAVDTVDILAGQPDWRQVTLVRLPAPAVPPAGQRVDIAARFGASAGALAGALP